ncbi:MAG: oxidoreductase-like protein [Castellaniella sp.]|uniref:oxidoreductase-like domain-containing protein n=1 Tax=Castellaniella sp. TaxID=1955812 RepID=UPI00120C8FFC|nr:oxidoreductase-like domain-containing protein [Castellaniella sp.]TAN29929.1 MAG: oxidoreductase-like protein [Castellaniella sp.]
MPDSRFPENDTRPAEPVEPDLNECCGNGCTPCVFDTYAEDKRRWQEAVRAWDLRHPDAGPKPD